MATSQETITSSGQRFGISNVAYDLVTLIHEKSKGLEAFSAYIKDAQGNQEVLNILQQCQQNDQQAVQQLTQCLKTVLSQGQ